MKKLIYIAGVRIPTEKAHGIQIMKMCEAFAEQGVDVTLVVPDRANNINEDAFLFHGVKRNFSIVRLPVIDLVWIGRFGFLITTVLFSLATRSYVLKHQTSKTVVYGRGDIALWCVSRVAHNLFWEVHDGRMNSIVRVLLQRVKGLVAISRGVKDFYIQAKVLPKSNILIAPDGVDIEQFDIKETREECRKRLKLPTDKKIVLYTGHLYDWKGADTLALAAQSFPNDILTIFVGGTDKDTEIFRKKYQNENIQFLERKPHKEIPYYLRAADVLVLPNSGKQNISKYYTSPLKLFEYMASGTPIVASDLSSIREILDEQSAVFVPPDDSEALATGIEKAHNAVDLAARARQEVEQYSWNKRAQKIIDFIQKNVT